MDSTSSMFRLGSVIDKLWFIYDDSIKVMFVSIFCHFYQLFFRRTKSWMPLKFEKLRSMF
jgi:hypothetical protein